MDWNVFSIGFLAGMLVLWLCVIILHTLIPNYPDWLIEKCIDNQQWCEVEHSKLYEVIFLNNTED